MPLSDRDRKTLKYGGIVAGVLIVGVLLMNLLGGGGGSTENALPSFSVHPSSPTPTATATPTNTGGSPVAVFAGRDPFSIPPGFSPSATSTPPPTSGSTTPPPTSGSTTPPPTTPPPSQPGNGSSGTQGGHTVVLIDVYQHNGVTHAQVEIDGVVYRPGVGENFGPNNRFKLVSASGNCASMLFGDQSFSLCITPQK
ncbi:MAG: hypothetical protein ACXVWF_09510 [Actinomycetota bacterium]